MAIVVGFVSTPEGRAALRRASEEAAVRSTRLVVVNSARGGRDTSVDDNRRSDAELKQVQDELTAGQVDYEVRQMVRGLEPSEDLIQVAEEVSADMIVIGLRRRTPVGKLILGSNAQRILLEATCPVLAVKADAAG